MLQGHRGFSLIEVTIVLALVALLGLIAWPSWREQVLRSRRVDATGALMRLERVQSDYRDTHGSYATRLDQLRGAGSDTSPAGHYRLSLDSSLQPDGTPGYVAVALALNGQTQDHDCTRIGLSVHGAVSEQLPNARCWLP